MLPRAVKILPLELVGEVKKNSPVSEKAKVLNIYKVKCPYCLETFSGRFISTHLKKVHGKSYSEALRYRNNITLDKCYLCDSHQSIVFHDKLKPFLRPTCSKCAHSYGKMLQAETLKLTIDEDSGKSLMRLRMDKQFNTMKNTIDPETGKDLFELYLERIEYNTRTVATKFRNTELYYRSSYELDFLNKNYEKLGLTRAPIIKNYYKDKYYTPDAFIPSTNTIVEIKSTGVMMVRQSPLEVYQKFSKALELEYNILFVLDYKEYLFSSKIELDEFFSKWLTCTGNSS